MSLLRKSVLHPRHFGPLALIVFALILASILTSDEAERERLGIVVSLMAAFAAIIVALLTAQNVESAQELVKETVRLRRLESDPDIGIYLEKHTDSTWVIDMIIKNVGRGPAYDVRFQADSNQELWSGYKLSEVWLIQNGLDYMAPGQTIRMTLGGFVELTKDPIQLVVNYRGGEKTSEPQTFSAPFALMVNQFRGMFEIMGESPEEQSSRALKEMAQAVQNVASNRATISIDISRVLWLRRKRNRRYLGEPTRLQQTRNRVAELFRSARPRHE